MLLIGEITAVSENNMGGATLSVDNMMDLYVPAELVEVMLLPTVGDSVCITMEVFGIVDCIESKPYLIW